MPGDSGELAVNTRVHSNHYLAHEAAGALGTRHSPRPLWGETNRQTPGETSRGNAKVCLGFRLFESLHWSRMLIACRPGLEPGPTITGVSCRTKIVEQRLSQQASRRMGPGVRRDDDKVDSASPRLPRPRRRAMRLLRRAMARPAGWRMALRRGAALQALLQRVHQADDVAVSYTHLTLP